MSDMRSGLRAYASYLEEQRTPVSGESIIAGAALGPKRFPANGRRRLVRPLAAALAVIAVLVGLAVLAPHGSDVAVRTGPGPAVTQPDSTRLLYTHRSPDGSTVTARLGRVELPSEQSCAAITSATDIICQPGPGGSTTGPGVVFDYSINGHHYQSVVLDIPGGNAEPGFVMAPLFGYAWANEPNTAGHLIILRVSPRITQVVLPRSGAGGASPEGDQMAPVDGWVTFPIQNLVRLTDPEALDAQGTVVGTSNPFPCC